MFFDVASIEPGDDFRLKIASWLQSSYVALAIIGEKWADITDATGRPRLDDPNDMVRCELSMALSSKARVIPVLLDDARMPKASQLPEDLKPLASRNAQFIRGAAFHRDMEYLGKYLYEMVQDSEKAAAPMPKVQGDKGDSSPKSAAQSPLKSVPWSQDEQISKANPEVRAQLMETFGEFRDKQPDDAFLICETKSEQFVQFVKGEKGSIILDLPSQALTPEQLDLAQRVLSESYTLDRIAIGGKSFSYEVTLPFEPAFLSYYTLSIFEKVYGVIPSEPLKITMDH